MTKLIAIHALHLASAVPGKVDVINPGESFVATDDELYLVEHHAARKPTSDDKHAVEAVRAREPVAKAPEAADETKTDLGKMTKAELTALAGAEKIDISDAKTNAEIVAAIEADRAAKQDDLV